MVKKRKRNVVTPDMMDNEALVLALESQGNAIPPQVATVIRLVAPILARIAIRFIVRKARLKVSDMQVNTASRFVGRKVGEIIKRAMEDNPGK